MNFYSIPNLIAGVFCFLLGLLVFLKNRKSLPNISFLIMATSTSIWQIGTFGVLLSSTPQTALLLCRITYWGAVFIPIATYHFAVSFLKKRNQKKFVVIFYLLGIFILLPISQTDFFLSGINKYFWGYWFKASFLQPLFLLFFALLSTLSLINLYLSYKKCVTPLEKLRIRFLLIALFIAYIGGSVDFLPDYGINIYPFGYIALVMCLSLIAYAIARYRLMDIKLAITRFGIFAVVYAIVLGIPFWIGYKYHLWYYSTAIMGILATLGPFIYLRLEKRSKELLYKTEFKRYETLRHFSKTLLLIKELDQLANMIVYRLVKTLRVSYAAIYLYNKEKDAYILKSFRPIKYFNAPKETTLTKYNALIRLLFNWKKELVREELKNLPITRQDKNSTDHQLTLEEAQNQMFKISATLIIPHFLDAELLGFLVLGDKEKGAIYTEEDISTLSALSNSAALAIENALFLIDLKITQAQLFNAKRIAELGYMASAMGHEINNRLQAIYSAALDMTDNPAIYDSIRHNPQVKTAFDKDISFINENVEDATKIINELKAYARPQDSAKQTFESVNLESIIEKAVNVVQLQSVKAFEMIELTLDALPTIPPTYGNFIQLQQVFVNLLNNAHDAIIEMREYVSHHPELNITNYKGRIDIKIEEVKNKLNIHIIDNGIGMTEEIKKRVFVPLYTSKATSERKAERGIKGGTGIGLYTIQTIMKGHEGSIEIYKTERLKGADFLITLPIAREKELAKKG